MFFGDKFPTSRLADYDPYKTGQYTPQYTLPKTNIAPKNRPSQKETSIPTIHFQVRKC